MPFEDIHFQLVDLPPIAPEHPLPWLANTLESADGDLLVLDLGASDCLEQVQALHAVLRERRVTLTERWEHGEEHPQSEEPFDEDPFALRLPTLILASKSDRIAAVEAELEAFREITGLRYPALAVSAASGQGLGEDRASAVSPSRDSARLHQSPGASRRQVTAVHATPRPDGRGRRAACASRPRARAQIRPGLGGLRLRRPAGRARPSCCGWRHHRAARLAARPWSFTDMARGAFAYKMDHGAVMKASSSLVAVNF